MMSIFPLRGQSKGNIWKGMSSRGILVRDNLFHIPLNEIKQYHQKVTFLSKIFQERETQEADIESNALSFWLDKRIWQTIF